jgi:hypothetical protein
VRRIERQVRLQPLQRIDQQSPERVEYQESERVLLPVHQPLAIDQAEAVEAAFKWRAGACDGAGAIEHAGHISAEWLDEPQ